LSTQDTSTQFILFPGTILILLGAAHQMLRLEKRAQAIKMMKTGK
jgi:hypothetical protein